MNAMTFAYLTLYLATFMGNLFPVDMQERGSIHSSGVCREALSALLEEGLFNYIYQILDGTPSSIRTECPNILSRHCKFQFGPASF
jgi:hypothetical protein